MNPIAVIGLCFTVLAFAGCASFRPVAAGTPRITLDSVEERSIRMGAKATLPAGDYLPDFQSEEGVFYLAPTSVTIRSLGIEMPVRGGLFVPFDKTKRQRAWAHQVAAGASPLGALLTGDSGGIATYPFDDPIAFKSK